MRLRLCKPEQYSKIQGRIAIPQMKPSRIYPVEENACEARATTLRSLLPLSLSLILKITLADNHRVSLLHSLRPRPPVMTMRLLMTGRMRKCHQSYVRALANCREAKERERAEEEEKEWEEGRASQRDISGEQCRSCRNMIRTISPSKAAWHGRHARIRMKGPFRKPEPPLCVPRFSKRVLRIHSS